MKINLLRRATLALALSLAVPLSATPLNRETPVHARPDAASPVLATLPAGADPDPAIETAAPAGWLAVNLTGPHIVYAANKDINKANEVRPGGAYRLAPKADAPVLATAEDGDMTAITKLAGKWTELSLAKTVVGYLPLAPAPAPAISPAPAAATSTPAASPTPAPAPSPVDASLAAAPFKLANTPPAAGTVVDSGDGGASALPRLFQGTMASTRAPLRPRRPFDYQLNDSAGVRYAYLDTSKLLPTERIEKYIDRTVVVYGTAQAVPDSRDMVIRVESLQLR